MKEDTKCDECEREGRKGELECVKTWWDFSRSMQCSNINCQNMVHWPPVKKEESK